MTSEWLNLKQNRTVDEYEMEFSCFLRFASEGYKDNKHMKVRKFQNGLNVDIRHDVKMFKFTTLSTVVYKARVVERNKLECKK